jgi:hypothetical protein
VFFVLCLSHDANRAVKVAKSGLFNWPLPEQIRPYGAGFGQCDDFFKSAKLRNPPPITRFIFYCLKGPATGLKYPLAGVV